MFRMASRKQILTCTDRYGVPPNTPTEFMVQFFANLERKGLINRAEANDILHISKMCDTDNDDIIHSAADDRQLKPRRPPSPDARERLLKDIRSRPKLRHVRCGRVVVDTCQSHVKTHKKVEQPLPARKIIKPDFNLLLNNSFEESAEDEDHIRKYSLTASSVTDLSSLSGRALPQPTSRHKKDDDFGMENSEGRNAMMQRRHTISLCQYPVVGKKRWKNPIECLSLTLEEVGHIRTVMTKAELESLAVQPEVYQQVSKGKLCFTCKTTRFVLFGEWGTRCRFCQRTVCAKCIRKMNVPTDHFSNIPVYTLSHSPMAMEMQEFVQKIIRTAPPPSVPPTRAPSPNRSHTETDQLWNLQNKQISLTQDDQRTSRRTFSRTKFLHKIQPPHGQDTKNRPEIPQIIKGPMMAICCNCSKTVTEIIRASRALISSSSAATSASNLRHVPVSLVRK